MEMINLVNFDISLLPSIAFSELKRLPHIPAIYFCLKASNEIVYIGQTKSLYRRWNKDFHERKRDCLKTGVQLVAWIDNVPVNDFERRSIEKRLIQFYRPTLNYKKQREETLHKIEAILGVNFGANFE
jgi:excinuclease UvrABC nuclease subunit